MQWKELRSHIRHLPVRDIGRIEQAFQLGKKLHEGQKRRSGEPYFNHPIAVTHMLLDLKADTDTIIAALLHDTVEDTHLTLAEAERLFGPSVAALINGVTKLSSKDVAMSPKLDEQIETLRKIFTLMQEDVRIMVIKLVDRLHNMQTVEFLPPERQHLLAKETLEVFVKIADKLCMQDMRDELESLCLSVLEPELHAALLEIRNTNEERSMKIIEQLREGIRTHDRILGSKTDLSFEPKTWDRIKAQLKLGDSVATGVSYITVVLVCEDTDACYSTLGALHQLWKREVLSFQDFINEPQLNGYQGLHTTIIVHDGTRVRCKIRTKAMHAYARLGITTKCFDAKALGVQEYLPWTKRLTSLTEDTEGSSDDFWVNLQNDILGETIIIHGPGDEKVQLPQRSTILDGAFYLLQDRALRTRSILMNGNEKPFDTPLENAASLDIILGNEDTFSHDWFQYVQTGYAQAILRTAMMQLSETKRASIGRTQLQEIFRQHKKGFIEEVNEEELSMKAKNFGFTSLNDVLVSIGDGRMTAEAVYEILYEKARNVSSDADARHTIECNFESPDILARIQLILLQYGSKLHELRCWKKGQQTRCRIHVLLVEHELPQLMRSLRDTGARNVTVSERRWKQTVILGVIITLWSLHPPIARWFLMQGVAPVTLTTFRLGIFCLCSILFFAVWRRLYRHHYSPIPHIVRLAFLPAVTTVAISAFMYQALLVVPTALHLTIMRANFLLIPLVVLLRKRIPSISRFLIIGVTVASIFLALFPSGTTIWLGIGFSVLTMLMYATYTQVIGITLQENKIGLRYPYILFVTGLYLGAVTLVLLPFAQLDILTLRMGILLVLAMVVFMFVPHACFYALLQKRQRQMAADPFFLEAPMGGLAEILLIGTVLQPSEYLALAVGLLALFYVHWKRSAKVVG